MAWFVRQRNTRRAVELAADAEAMLERLPAVPKETRRAIGARLACVRGEAKMLFGEIAPARELAKDACDAFAALNDPIGLGDAHLLRMFIEREAGDAPAATSALEAASLAFERSGEPVRARIVAAIAAERDLTSGRVREVPYSPAADAPSHPGALTFELDVAATVALGSLKPIDTGTFLLGAYQRAMECGLIAEAIRHSLNYNISLSGLGDVASALEGKLRITDVARATGWPRWIAACLTQVAAELGELKRWDASRALLNEALALAAPIGVSRTYVNACSFMSDTSLELGLDEEALHWAETGRNAAAAIEHLDQQVQCIRLLALAHARLGHREEALEAAQNGVAMCTAGLQMTYHHILMLMALAEVHRRFEIGGETPLSILTRALDLVEVGAAFSGSDQLLEELSEEHAKLGNFERAHHLLQQMIALRATKLSQAATDRATALEVQRETERSRRETEAMERARDAAEEANRAKSAFLAAMSHEIRTPMNAITGMAELLSLTALGEDQAGMLALIRESAAGLLRLIDDILDFSKIEAGKLELERTPFSPAATAAVVVQTLMPAAEKKGLALRANLAPGLPRFFGDPFRFRQILFNLTGNALKFTAEGGITVDVGQTISADGSAHLTLSVSDTGIGIDADTLARLFKPFAQADDSTTRRFGGTGLGLSISRRIAEAMGGTIAVTSVPGQGSTFTVSLPVEVAGEDDDGHALPSTPAEAQVFPGLRVLVAEDQPAGRNVIGRQLATLRIDAAIVDDGAQAFDAFRNGTYDLLITDCHMPNIDGFELTRMIRRREQGGTTRLPILALTANALHGEADACLAAGMDAYVSKPASLAQLTVKIAALCGSGTAAPGGLTVRTSAANSEFIAVDIGALGELIGERDERELLAIVCDYLATCDRPLVNAHDAARSADCEGLRKAAHAGKGSALNVCARALGDAWAGVEAAAARGDLIDAAGGLAAVESELASVKAFAEAKRSSSSNGAA